MHLPHHDVILLAVARPLAGISGFQETYGLAVQMGVFLWQRLQL